MTTETQTFISPSDIKAIRVECPSCHVKTSVALDSEQAVQRAIVLCTRFQCVHCHFECFTVKDSSYAEALGRFIDTLVTMRARENDGTKSITFQIATPCKVIVREPTP